jgi:protein TonB
MAYMNLLHRLRADMQDGADEYRRDIQSADEWVRKALQTKQQKGGARNPSMVPAPPPPPPPPARREAFGGVRVGAAEQAARLIRQVAPEYPAAAKEARIQGTVRFNVLINRSGSVEQVQLVSGHPLFVEPATAALKQYLYEPTYLNGQPVEVSTTVDLTFVLGGLR